MVPEDAAPGGQWLKLALRRGRGHEEKFARLELESVHFDPALDAKEERKGCSFGSAAWPVE